MALALLAGVVMSGCQPLYGDKPDKLPTLAKKPHKDEPTADVQIKDVDNCAADFHAPAANVHPNTNASVQLTIEGDSALAGVDKEPDAAAKTNKMRDGIDRYRNALLKDPYNPDATLKLALAYDRVYRKGCAIAMLKRLASLSVNPKFATQANRDIDSIGDNSEWFKRYRQDAMSAVGR